MARSSSRNAVSFSSAGTTKRFPSPRCTSATILSDRTTPLLANATVWNGQLAARLFWLAEKHLETHWRKERVPQAERNDFFRRDLSEGGGPALPLRAPGYPLGRPSCRPRTRAVRPCNGLQSVALAAPYLGKRPGSA